MEWLQLMSTSQSTSTSSSASACNIASAHLDRVVAFQLELERVELVHGDFEMLQEEDGDSVIDVSRKVSRTLRSATEA